ncbi:hypothetical protein [Oryzisolibacter propanilivorax]|nr:hypothetical protein [Oryzisolibacter propanilivorax]
MALLSMLESLALMHWQKRFSGGGFCPPFVAAWRLPTATAFLYYKLENLS